MLETGKQPWIQARRAHKCSPSTKYNESTGRGNERNAIRFTDAHHDYVINTDMLLIALISPITVGPEHFSADSD